jgi:hypothetical protein
MYFGIKKKREKNKNPPNLAGPTKGTSSNPTARALGSSQPSRRRPLLCSLISPLSLFSLSFTPASQASGLVAPYRACRRAPAPPWSSARPKPARRRYAPDATTDPALRQTTERPCTAAPSHRAARRPRPPRPRSPARPFVPRR